MPLVHLLVERELMCAFKHLSTAARHIEIADELVAIPGVEVEDFDPSEVGRCLVRIVDSTDALLDVMRYDKGLDPMDIMEDLDEARKDAVRQMRA